MLFRPLAWIALGMVVSTPQLCMPSTSVTCEQSQTVAVTADAMYDDGTVGDDALYNYLMQHVQEDTSEDSELLWRLARAIYQVAENTAGVSKADKKEMINRAFKVAQRAVEYGEGNFAAYKWCGILLTSVGDFESTKTRIGNSYKIRDFFERAVQLNPQDATSNHLLGRWCVAIASISWVERKAAALVFGTPPESSYEDALEHFLRAEEISPGFWKKNLVMIATCYAKLGDKENARVYYEQAVDVPTKTNEDKECHEEATKALGRL